MKKHDLGCEMPALTLKTAKSLTTGAVLYHRTYANADGTPRRFKVNGAVKTWKSKRNALRVKIPVKHGLYEFGYVSQDATGEGNLSDFSLSDGS